jgi:ribulose-5-phosphate 4-epimerase/fuculose-1-phosphate aldolase
MVNKTESDLLELSRACRILEMEGHGDFSLGHLSLRDPDGRGFWLKRNRAGLGEIVGVEDFVLVDMEGRQLAGSGGLHSEWPIHSEVFRLRSDVNVVAHTHPFYASVMSASTEPLIPFSLDADYFIDVPRHDADVALIKKKEEGLELAQSLGDGYAAFIANHGLLFCGKSIPHATCVGVFLEHACKAHIVGRSAGFTYSAPKRPVRELRRSQMMTDVHVEHTWNYLCRKLDHLLQTAPDGRGLVYRL